MPLLNRKPYQCDASLPEGLKDGEEVFVIEHSKEVFRDYAAYVKKVELYKKPLWSCKYTGRGALTFEDALAEEQKALASLAKFPQELEEQVVRTVHHALLPLDKLLSKVYDELRPPKAGEAATAAAAEQAEQQQEGGDPASAKAAHGAADADNNAIVAAGAAQGGPEVSPLAEKENKVQQAAPAAASAAAAGVAAKPEKPAEKSGPKKPKAPVARQLLRTFVLEHASQQGPEGGKLQVWMVKPEFAEKYKLPAEVPEEVKSKLAAAAKPPKKRPSDAAAVAIGKQEKKVRKEGAGSGKKAAAAAPAAASRPTSASPHGPAASGAPMDMSGEGSRAEGMDDSEPPKVPVKAKSLEEVESQYKDGTIKHVMVKVLKAHPEGLTTAALVDQAKEMGLAEYDDKQKRTIRFNFSNDPNFVRMAQAGVYSLHCLHPELVVLQKPPVPRKRKITEHFLSPGEGVEGQQEGSAAAAAAGKPLAKVESRVDLGGEQAAEKKGKKNQQMAGKPQAAEAQQQVQEEEVDGITKAERLIKQAKAAAERHRSALAGAQRAFDEAKKALVDVRKAMQLPSPSKAREAEVQLPPEQLAQFELSAEEREFKGQEGDRKALSEHRQYLQRRVKELEAQKKAFIEAERAKREDERAKREADLKNSNTQYKAAEAALKKREHELAQARRAAESATKALAEAERKLAQERKKVETAEAKAKEKEEKEKQRQAEKEERERRKAEAQAAKRYPIDDLELLQELTQAAAQAGDPTPTADVKPPSWLGGQEQSRLASGLYVSDFLHQFGKSLGLKSLSFSDLERVLGAAGSKDAASGDELGAATLHGIYQQLLQVLLDDLRASGEIGATERRWRCVLSEGTWPEVLRRYVLTRAHADEAYKRPTEHVALAAGMLGFNTADGLTHDQHLHLLRFLCDEVLDTEKMRTALQKRADGADDARRDILKEMAEERKKLRAQQEQEREERKRRMEEDKKKQEEEKAVAAAAAAADGSAAQDGNAADQARSGGLSKQGSMDVGAAAAAAGTPAEPSFELPNELREYQGDPDDKKGILQFRQQQQAEKRRLKKERNKWLAEQLRRQREIETKLKEQREAEKAKQREKEAAEEAIARAQDELEEALERHSTRRLPLGCDRHHRRYWWGLVAHRPAVYVEDEQGRWGAFTTMEEVESLLESLDRRGVRELALAQALEKRMGTIQVAMRKAAQAEDKDKDRAPKSTKAARAEKAPPQPLRRSGREAQPVEFYNPGKAAGAATTAAAGAGGSRPSSAALAGASKASSKATVAAIEAAGLLGPSELAAFQGVLADLAALEKAAAAADVAPPATSWADWEESLRVLAEGQSGQKAAAVGLRRALQARLQELEAAIYGASDKRDNEVGADEDNSSEGQDDEGSEGDREGSAEPEDRAGPSHTESLEVVEYVDSDGELSPTKGPRDVAWLWRSSKERSTWQADLSQAGTIARLAYCASVLLQQAEPLLHTLRRAAAKRGSSQGAAAAPAAAVAAPGQPARGGSKPAWPRGRASAAAAGTAAAGAEAEDGGNKEEAQRAAREARRHAREWGIVPADLLEAGGKKSKASSGAREASAAAGKRKGAGLAAPAPAEDVRVTRARRG